MGLTASYCSNQRQRQSSGGFDVSPLPSVNPFFIGLSFLS